MITLPSILIINGVKHSVIEQRESFYFRALVLPYNGGDPKWLSDKEVVSILGELIE